MRPVAVGCSLVVAASCACSPGVRPSLSWRPCSQARTVYCATLRVPVDWARPHGGTITLTLAKLPASDPAHRIGAVLDVPGGPGESGVDALSRLSAAHRAMRRRFDVVSYNPRTNVAQAILPRACTRPGPSLTDPRTRGAYARQAAVLDRSVGDCRRADRSGLLAHLDSISIARDMDAVRRALGQERLTFVARSNGGVPMTAYARLFPQHVRAAYFDGVPDHVDAWSDSGAMWLTGTEKAFTRFASWCAATAACRLHGRPVRSLWRALLKQAGTAPLPVRSGPFRGRRLTAWHLKISAPVFLVDAASDRTSWKAFAEAIDRARHGDGSGFGDTSFGMSQIWTAPVSLAMQCADGLWGRTGYADLRRSRRAAERSSADFGSVSFTTIACTGWTTPVVNPPRPLAGGRLPPFLGSGSDPGDYETTRRLLRHVPGSVTIHYDGPGHVSYLNGTAGGACVVGHLVRYIENLRLPPPTAVCRP
ncbi:alpha/beta fold hydrolase [Microbispora sp. ZYX-F-249]|uniref:Alpha/beta fold hydrolase n=1 Tax=Microbispora maris TaxID=3144104 RepID=A0ABV0ALT6_9ACTN